MLSSGSGTRMYQYVSERCPYVTQISLGFTQALLTPESSKKKKLPPRLRPCSGPLPDFARDSKCREVTQDVAKFRDDRSIRLDAQSGCTHRYGQTGISRLLYTCKNVFEGHESNTMASTMADKYDYLHYFV